ncbi:hypothetical protein BN1708_019414, partial [Verticillium longisporum]
RVPSEPRRPGLLVSRRPLRRRLDRAAPPRHPRQQGPRHARLARLRPV